MDPFKHITAVAAPLPIANIDTDQIIPKQFLATVERTGLAKGLFYDMRFDKDGNFIEDFVLHRPEYQGAQILIAGPNFGCGSSREHAPWALADFGIRCVIASGFADIFYNNCFNNGILPLVLDQGDVERLLDEARGANHKFEIDLASQTVKSPSGAEYRFEIEPGRKQKLLEGLDDIGMTLKRDDDIAAFEEKRRIGAPWRR
jgi:3-isopropylmalate/(R)-2-methylmalate dehydratase small subunit